MKLKSRKVFSLLPLFFSFFLVEKVFAVGFGDLLGLIDWSCINPQVIGVCWKGPVPGLIISFWEPVLLVETVKNPGSTVIESIEPMIASAAKTAAKNALGSLASGISVTSGSGSSSFDQTNLQFSETHIYDFPFKDVITALFGGGDCPSTPSMGFVKYLSEVDSFEWRVGIIEAMHPKSMVSAASGAICSILSNFNSYLCIGSWGAMYPRRGFFVHSSPVVSSAALVWRAVNIASLSGMAGHIVTSPLPFNQSFSEDKLQLIYPATSSCIKPGQNPVSWDYGKTSANGKYLWVYWIKRTCCVY